MLVGPIFTNEFYSTNSYYDFIVSNKTAIEKMCNFFNKFGPPRQMLALLSGNSGSIVLLLLDPDMCKDTSAGVSAMMSLVAPMY